MICMVWYKACVRVFDTSLVVLQGFSLDHSTSFLIRAVQSSFGQDFTTYSICRLPVRLGRERGRFAGIHMSPSVDCKSVMKGLCRVQGCRHSFVAFLQRAICSTSSCVGLRGLYFDV